MKDNEYDLSSLYQNEISKLRKEVELLKQACRDNELEIDDVNLTSIEEAICINGITALAALFENGNFTKEDVTSFDVLHKNLRLIRGLNVDEGKKKGKTAPVSKEQLIRIVNGGKTS